MQKRLQWKNRLSFILAAAGSAIGLGNIWKFPYIAGKNGGGAFVLIYLVCIAMVGIPIFIAELYIGQQAQSNTIAAFEHLHRRKTPWRLPGWFGLISAFLILSFYSVVGGWVLDFEFRSLVNEFASLPVSDVRGVFGQLLHSPWIQSLWHLVFLGLTIGIVMGGVKEGLERWNRILMPALLLLLSALLVYSFTLTGAGKAIDFLFSFDSENLTSAGILEAVGHSFFTLSLGMGAIMIYGSYLSKKESLLKIALTVGILDTLIALMAGIVIFSVVFSFDMQPAAGPGLVFETLPTLFAQLPGAYILSVMFFMLMTFAALTSAVSILEVIVAYFSEHRGWSRHFSSLLCGAIIYLTGLLTVFSNNLLSDFHIFGLTFFDLFDRLTSSYLLPLGGLLISTFYGWILAPKALTMALGADKKGLHFWLLWSTRLVAPVAVFVVIVNNLMS